jgi:hypothetical protein
VDATQPETLAKLKVVGKPLLYKWQDERHPSDEETLYNKAMLERLRVPGVRKPRRCKKTKETPVQIGDKVSYAFAHGSLVMEPAGQNSSKVCFIKSEPDTRSSVAELHARLGVTERKQDSKCVQSVVPSAQEIELQRLEKEHEKRQHETAANLAHLQQQRAALVADLDALQPEEVDPDHCRKFTAIIHQIGSVDLQLKRLGGCICAGGNNVSGQRRTSQPRYLERYSSSLRVCLIKVRIVRPCA